MFYNTAVKTLDLSSFNTANVKFMYNMFSYCDSLTTIYVDDDWSTASVTRSEDMFKNCYSLIGGQGTTYDAEHVDAAYAHIDGGLNNPGYFTKKTSYQRGDVNGDGMVDISDVTALIDLLLAGGAAPAAADVDGNGDVAIDDVTALIDMLLQ